MNVDHRLAGDQLKGILINISRQNLSNVQTENAFTRQFYAPMTDQLQTYIKVD